MAKLKTENRQAGFTAVEMMIVVAILGVLTALAMPSFQDTLQRRHIVSAAEAIASDIRWARGEAIKRNTTITITFTDGDPWSYEINTAADAVALPIVCPPPGTSLKAVCSGDVDDYDDVTLANNFTSDNTGFDPVRGLTDDGIADGLDNGTISLTSAIGELRVIVSTLGRVRVCAVGGTIGGYESC